MKNFRFIILFLLCLLVPFSYAQTPISAERYAAELKERLKRISEFEVLREWGKAHGVRIWLGGGTATGIASYLKEELEHQNLKERFPYTYYDIYRSTQDADIIIDATEEQAQELEAFIEKKLSYLQGSKKLWEVRLLKLSRGEGANKKSALIGDTNFSEQNTDSFSTALVELTDSNEESIVRDLFHWQDKNGKPFVDDLLNGTITFFRNPKHALTERAQAGFNPEIISVIRAYTKAFQYDANISESSKPALQEIIDAFNPNEKYSAEAVRYIRNNGMKLFLHSRDLERSWNELEASGLRKKLIIFAEKNSLPELAALLNREPLRTYALASESIEAPFSGYKPSGKTAGELGITEVAHETRDFLAYENITMSRFGKANLFISRQGLKTEAAVYGDGAYTRVGRKGAIGSNLTIRYRVDPNAVEGKDFFIANGDYIVFRNAKALFTLPEDKIALSFKEFFTLLLNGKFESSDLGVIKKLELKSRSISVSTDEANEVFEIVKARAKEQNGYIIDAAITFFVKSPIDRNLKIQTIGLIMANQKIEDVAKIKFFFESEMEYLLNEKAAEPEYKKLIEAFSSVSTHNFDYVSAGSKIFAMKNIDKQTRDKIATKLVKHMKYLRGYHHSGDSWELRNVYQPILNAYLENESAPADLFFKEAFHPTNPRLREWYPKFSKDADGARQIFSLYCERGYINFPEWRVMYEKYKAQDPEFAVKIVANNFKGYAEEQLKVLISYKELEPLIEKHYRSYYGRSMRTSYAGEEYIPSLQYILSKYNVIPKEYEMAALGFNPYRFENYRKISKDLDSQLLAFEKFTINGDFQSAEWNDLYKKYQKMLKPKEMKEYIGYGLSRHGKHRNGNYEEQFRAILKYPELREIALSKLMSNFNMISYDPNHRYKEELFQALNAYLETEATMTKATAKWALHEANPQREKWKTMQIIENPSFFSKICSLLFKKH